MKSRDIILIIVVTAATVIGFCGLFGVLVFVSNRSDSPSASGNSDNDQLRDAWFKCKIAVLDRLKNPDSADFPYTSDVRGTRGPTGTITIRSYVDATNGFGAVVRTPFVCEARRSGTNFVATVELLE